MGLDGNDTSDERVDISVSKEVILNKTVEEGIIPVEGKDGEKDKSKKFSKKKWCLLITSTIIALGTIIAIIITVLLPDPEPETVPLTKM